MGYIGWCWVGNVKMGKTKHLILLAIATFLGAGGQILAAVGGVGQFQNLLEVGLEHVGPDGDVLEKVENVVDALGDRKGQDVADLGNVFANGVEWGPDCGGLVDDRCEDHCEHRFGRVGQDATSDRENKIVQRLHAQDAGQENVDGVHKSVEGHVVRKEPQHPDGDRFVIASTLDDV